MDFLTLESLIFFFPHILVDPKLLKLLGTVLSVGDPGPALISF